MAPQRQKMYLRTPAHGEDSDKPAHTRSTIRIFPGRILDMQRCTVSSCGQRRLKSDCARAVWFESSLDAHVRLYVITKTCLYSFDPLKPHFYIVKIGFTGVYIIFIISAQNIDCGYSLEPPRRGGSSVYPQSMFSAEIWEISEYFLSDFFSFFGCKIFNIL